MLERQNGRRHQHRHLIALRHALEGGTHGDLGLAVAHVPAQQAVHGNGTLHVLPDVVNGGKLPVGLLVLKGGGKLLLEIVVRRKGVPRTAHPLGVQADEILCHLPDDRLGLCLGAVPAVRPDVLGHHVQLLDRDVQLIRPGVLDADIVPADSRRRQVLDAGEAPDAVGFMHHKVARLQVVEGKDRAGVAPPRLVRRPLAAAQDCRGGRQRSGTAVGIGGQDGNARHYQLIAEQVVIQPLCLIHQQRHAVFHRINHNGYRVVQHPGLSGPQEHTADGNQRRQHRQYQHHAHPGGEEFFHASAPSTGIPARRSISPTWHTGSPMTL